MNAISESFQGDQALEVYQEIVGATDFVPGPGADYIPNAVGEGGIGTHVLSKDAQSKLLDMPVIDKILFRVEGLSDTGIEAARKAIEELKTNRMDVTHEAVLQALQG